MVEPGGPTTQTGIWYQNSVAGLYLGDLLDLKPRPQRERVVEVRLEAPTDVDDIVVRYADGHRNWIQAKSNIAIASYVWKKLWKNIDHQCLSSEFGGDDSIVLVLGDGTSLAASLRECCERASNSQEKNEWGTRLTKSQKRVVAAVQKALRSSRSGGDRAYQLLKRTTVEIIPWRLLERDHAPYRIPDSNVTYSKLLSALRDIAGGGARVRATFRASPLRARLLLDQNISVFEPSNWGLSVYRDTLSRLAAVDVPGTALSGSVRDLFIWPTARNYDRARQADFEDEDVRRSWGVDPAIVDLKAFPGTRLRRVIVMAGPGFGKSMLLEAISDRLHSGPAVPVVIPLTALSTSGKEIADYLAENVNQEYSVAIDWGRLNEAGLTVLLLDGLDEIPNGRRQNAIRRVELFSARYPHVPWLITVRDPGAVPTRFEAQIVELLPLRDDEIAEFATRWSKRLGHIDGWRLTGKLDAYPDLKRLTRIPLFLSILLATWREDNTLPQNRAQLIEVYLGTLFNPERHKDTVGQSYDSRTLRSAAERLAFNLLKNQEIGGAERSVMDILANVVPDVNPKALLDQLRQRGVLRHQTALRYVFPFPIVQEYLAAHYLISHRLSEVPQRVRDAVKRPWAQVVQFALELHPDPTPLVRTVLGQADDAFATGLRLIARCTVNGMKMGEELRSEIGRRLASSWPSPSWSLRSRVGQLLYDGWSAPMLPEVREKLANRWLLSNGAAEIICAQDSAALTHSLLAVYVEQYLDSFSHPHPIRSAIDAIADDAFALYAIAAHRSNLSDEEVSSVASLIQFLDHRKLSPGLAETLAFDQTVHDRIRLASFSRTREVLDSRAQPLIDKALRSSNWRDRFHVGAALSRSRDPISAISNILNDQTLSLERRRELVNELHWVVPDESVRRQFVERAIAKRSIVPEFRDFMLVYAASEKNDRAMNELVTRITKISTEVACSVVSLLGWYRTGHYAERALKGFKKRKLTASGAIAFASAVVTGMTSQFVMKGYNIGALEPTLPHPFTDEFAAMVEQLCGRYSFDLEGRLRINLSAAKLGSRRALDELFAVVMSIIREDTNTDQYDLNFALSDALSELRDKGRLIPLEDLWLLSNRSTSNALLRCIPMIAAHGTVEALSRLLELYNLGAEHGVAHAEAERLSSRLGIKILERDGRLVF